MPFIPTTGKPERTLYVITGESNSGGFGLNSAIPASELLPNPKVKIWHNLNGGFVDLQIGVNNLIGHSGLESSWHTRHGLERSLALDSKKPIWLVKAGQGGSRIGQWTPENVSGFYNTLVGRYTAAIAALEENGRYRVRTILIYWQGVNDANDGNTTVLNNWRNSTAAHFSRLRSLMGTETPIFALEVMNNTANKRFINTQIEHLDLADPFVFSVDCSNADGLVDLDTNHWTSQGFRICGQALTNLIGKTLPPYCQF